MDSGGPMFTFSTFPRDDIPEALRANNKQKEDEIIAFIWRMGRKGLVMLELLTDEQRRLDDVYPMIHTLDTRGSLFSVNTVSLTGKKMIACNSTKYKHVF